MKTEFKNITTNFTLNEDEKNTNINIKYKDIETDDDYFDPICDLTLDEYVDWELNK